MPSTRPRLVQLADQCGDARRSGGHGLAAVAALADRLVDVPARRKTSSRPMSGSNAGGPSEPASMTSVSSPASRRRSRTKASSRPFVSSVPTSTTGMDRSSPGADRRTRPPLAQPVPRGIIRRDGGPCYTVGRHWITGRAAGKPSPREIECDAGSRTADGRRGINGTRRVRDRRGAGDRAGDRAGPGRRPDTGWPWATSKRSAARSSAADLAEQGREALGLVLDVAEADDWDNAIARDTSRWGRLDVLVNNAGISPRGHGRDRPTRRSGTGPWRST